MKNFFNKSRGITLIALIITIIILLILAGISTYSGLATIRLSKFTTFKTELKIMQTKVNEWYEEYKNGDNTSLSLGQEISANPEVEAQANKVFTANASGITDKEGYKFFSKEEIKSLGVDGVEQDLFINIEKRSVISYEGFEYENVMYYLLSQTSDDMYNVEYEPTFKKVWASKIDGNGEEEFLSVKQTSDGGYIAVGYTTSTDIQGLTNKGSADCLIAKFDSNGNEMWKKSVGGSKYDWYNDVIEIQNGTYIAVGTILSTDVVDKSGKNIGHGYDWSCSFSDDYSMEASEGIIGTYDSTGNEVSLKTTGKATDEYTENDFSQQTGDYWPFDVESVSSSNIVIIGISKVSDGYIITGKRFIGVPSTMATDNIIEGHLAIKYSSTGNEIAVSQIKYTTSLGQVGREIVINSYGDLSVLSRAWREVIELPDNSYILYGSVDNAGGIGSGVFKSDANLSNIQEIGQDSTIVKDCILDESNNYITIDYSSEFSFRRLKKQSDSEMIWQKTDKVIKSISKSDADKFVGLSDDNKFLKYNMEDGSILEEYDIPTYEEVYAIEGKEEYILLGTPKDEEGITIKGESGAVIAKYAVR